MSIRSVRRAPRNRSMMSGVLSARSTVVLGPLVSLLVCATGSVADEPPSLGGRVQRAGSGTVWWGGVGPDGIALPDGAWTFPAGAGLEGWSFEDVTDEGLHIQHVIAGSCLEHDEDRCPLITQDGSEGSLWCGSFSEHTPCWPDGQGYGNYWTQHLRKTFPYQGTGDVTLSFDYFCETEPDLDVLTVRIHPAVGEVTCDGGTSLLSVSGAVAAPESPAQSVIVVPEAALQGLGDAYVVDFCFVSDAAVSDGWDRGTDLFETEVGAYGLDDIRVEGGGVADLADFEPSGADPFDGWHPTAEPPVGSFGTVENLENLPGIHGDTTGCGLDGNVLLAADLAGPDAHPLDHAERLVSNPIPVPFPPSKVLLEWTVWGDQELEPGIKVPYRIGIRFYPWTCPRSGEPIWSPVGFGPAALISRTPPACYTATEDLLPYLDAASPESLRVELEVLYRCDSFLATCPPVGVATNPSPYFDDLRVGFVPGPVDVPPDPGLPAGMTLRASSRGREVIIRLQLEGEARVATIQAFDVTGRVVGTIAREASVHPGVNVFTWSTPDRGLADGLYFLRAQAGERTAATRVVLVD